METATWQLQEAKAHFSELVRTALEQGPQFISKHGQDTVVIMDVKEYYKLTQPKESLLEFFLSAPRAELKIERSKEVGREILL